MSGSVNKVILIGRVGKDPEIRRTSDGRPVATFGLATDEQWRDKSTGERKERTTWHNIVVFSEGLCKVVESYVRKGSKLYIEGSLQTRKWSDKDGNERYSTEVVLQGFNSVLKMLDGKPADDRSGDSQQSGGGNYSQAKDGWGDGAGVGAGHALDDDVPFAPEVR